MVKAFNAGIYQKPVLKLGHDDGRPGFDGDPSIGWIENLRVANGTVLLGDLHGVPRWLAEAAPTSYPTRSLEAVWGYRDADGIRWPTVLTGLALLGAQEPAIGNLAELRDFVTLARGATAPTDTTARRVAAARARRRRRAHHQ